MSTQKSRLFGALGALCDEIQTQKTAAATALRGKKASPTPSDPGYIGGSSSHPTASADNGCQTATEGERSSENESDVKDQQGAPSVNNTAEATPGADKDKSLNIGTKASLVGEDPSVEDDYKGDKDDPGTSHPASTEDGEKYGSFRKSARAAIELGNSILADLAVGAVAKTAAAPAPAGKPAAAAPAAAAGMLAGYEFAQALGMTDKVAQTQVRNVIADAVREGHEVGSMVGAFLRKKAADEAESGAGEDHASEKGKPEEAGGSGANAASSADGGGGGGGSPSPAGPPAGGDLGGGNPLASIMGGAGGGGAGGGGAAPGGDPMAGAMGGGAGGDPMGGQAASPEEALQELAMALQELGIPLDQLAAAGAAGAGGGMGGGMGAPPPGGMAPPPGAGAPPMDPAAAGGGMPPMGEGAKLAAAVQNFQRSGKFEIKAADTKRARHIRNQMKAHVLELINS